MIKVIPSQQGIASPLIEIEPSTTSNQYFDIFPRRIIEALQKSLPPGILVNFVQADATLSPWRQSRGPFPKIFRIFDNGFTMTFNVPIKIERLHPNLRKEMLGQCCFTHLPGTSNEGHSGLFSKKSSDFRSQISHRHNFYMAIKLS